MRRIFGPRSFDRAFVYVAAIAIAALVFTYQHVMQSRAQIYGPAIDSLSPLQKLQLDAFMSMNQLLITLATGLLAAIGFMMVNKRTADMAPTQFWVAAASAVFTGLSLYFGYKGYDDLLFMLQAPNPTFDLFGPLIHADRIAHFATLMLGTFLFADFVFHELSEENKNELGNSK